MVLPKTDRVLRSLKKGAMVIFKISKQQIRIHILGETQNKTQKKKFHTLMLFLN